MKKIVVFTSFLFYLLGKDVLNAQLNYSFSSATGTYNYLTGATNALSSNTADDALSSAITLPFTFYYNCQPYTQIKVSSNGWLTFDMSITSSMTYNDLDGTGSLIVAPLWDDLQCTQNVKYLTTGTSPNRIFKIEWREMEWDYGANVAVISFQVWLYETTNRIEFWYKQESGSVYSADASIGLNGSGSPLPFLSLNGTGGSPTASSTVETDNLNTKPANGQIYRWDPVTCSGAPTISNPVAVPNVRCSAYTTTLSLTPPSNAGCGITYQWQVANSAGGPWTNIGSASPTYTATYNMTGGSGTVRYFRCIATCGANTSTTSVISASIISQPCVCDLIQIPSLPYSTGNLTTCGMGNDVTSSNVSAVCGSSSYYGGEDVVYSFTPTTSGTVNINLNSSGSWTGIMLYQGCPLSGGTCVSQFQSSSGSKQLCANVTAGQVYYIVIDVFPSPSCNSYSLSVNLINTGSTSCNMGYTASSITYNFENFSGTALPMTDDRLFSTIVMFGFSTCWDGATYWGGYPASNSSFVFDAVPCFPNIQSTDYAAPNVWTGYSISAAAPVFGTSIPRNAILGPWHDINPASSATLATSKIQYATFGTAPNRRVVISWEDIPYYSFSCESSVLPRFSGQIKIFENGNIEIHIKNKQVCTSWNGGYAVMGLHNYDGTIYIPPVNMTAHNYPTQWTMSNAAYRFTPSGSCASGCVVLPIGFKSFYGERIQKVNHLYWETAEESDIKTFEILRSNDGINFEKIGITKPNNLPSKYHFEDITAPLGKINYYKIKSIENYGKESETRIISIDAEMNEVFVLSVFPNPASTEIYCTIESRLTTNNGKASVIAYDVYGNKVISKEINLLGGVNKYPVNIEELPGGVYVVEITINEKEKIVEKIIKN
ncbi:MAG: hypothetical protein KatS3mg027_2073 [Bacteroidia bacterium]|nr:MAG: hypothetical protein KatS3mg027_2073 [Bacteroidia bacterium]